VAIIDYSIMLYYQWSLQITWYLPATSNKSSFSIHRYLRFGEYWDLGKTSSFGFDTVQPQAVSGRECPLCRQRHLSNIL